MVMLVCDQKSFPYLLQTNERLRVLLDITKGRTISLVAARSGIKKETGEGGGSVAPNGTAHPL